MIFPLFLWCIFFFAICDVSNGYVDPFIIPVCENKGPGDVYLDFSNGEFIELSKSYMMESSIKCLNFESSNIVKIESDAFDNVPNLYYLNLGHNRIQFEDFIHTKIFNLKTLILDRAFNNGDPYRNNYPYHNGNPYPPGHPYHQTEDTTFSLPKLEKLSLSYYGDNHPRKTQLWFNRLDVPMLTHLHLSGNYLTTIANLARIPNLTHLNLDDNRLTYISGSFLKNLEYLSMDRNNIEKVCGTTCSLHSISPRGMKNLKYLSLGENKIRVIDSDAFTDLENLLVLNLTENKINEFEEHTFEKLTKLQNLTLDKNDLTRVPDVSALQELQILSLNENKITAIDVMTFHDMPKLTMLHMRSNNVTTIADMAFGDLPNLAMLDLAWNNINFLSEKWILPNFNLEVLRLDGNEFTDIGNMTLSELHNLNVLGLAHNPIEKISTRAMMKLPVDLVIDVTLDPSVPLGYRQLIGMSSR